MSNETDWWNRLTGSDAFPRLTAADYRVCLVLWRLQRGGAVAVASDVLARQARLASTGTLSRAVRRLASLGLIEIVETGARARPALYRILQPRTKGNLS